MTDEAINKSSADIANEFKILEASSRKLFNLPPYVNPNEFEAWKKEKEDIINKTNLLREQTKTREETYTGRSKYLERLATYSANFISNTTPVDPSQCAMHGWYGINTKCQVSGSEVFRLICKECNNHLDVPNLTGVNTSLESVKKIYALYPTFLYNTHNETCFWRHNSCHVSVCAFPLVTTSDAFNLLETQGKLFQKWETDLPLISNPYDQSKNKIIERIIKSIENIDVFDFPQQQLTEIQIISYLLPVFGWNCLEEQNYKLLKCSSCFRHIWVSNYLLIKDRINNGNNNNDNNQENTIQYHSRPERIKDYLNPIDEHRYYCPWKNADIARINLKDSFYVPAKSPLTGCQWMMEILFKEWFKLTSEDDKHPRRIEFRRKVEKHISTAVENNKWMTQDLSSRAISKKLKRSLSEVNVVEEEEEEEEEGGGGGRRGEKGELDVDKDENKDNVKKIKYEIQSENYQQTNKDQDSITSEMTNMIKVSPPVVNNNELETTATTDEYMSDNNIKQVDQSENIQQINADQNKLPKNEQQQLQQQQRVEVGEKEPVTNNTLDSLLSSSATDMISIMSPLSTSSPLPSDLLLNDIGSPAILENVQTLDILNDNELISDQVSKVVDDDQLDKEMKPSESEENNNNIIGESSSLEQKQEEDHIELMDISKEMSSEQKEIEKENEPIVVEQEQEQEEEGELVSEKGEIEVEEKELEIEKVDEKDQELNNIQEDTQLGIQKSEYVVNEKEEYKTDELADIQDLEEVQENVNNKVDESIETVMEVEEVNEKLEKEESLEDGELNEEQNIQLDHLISEDITTSKDEEEYESSKSQNIQIENDEAENEAIKEIEEKENLDNNEIKDQVVEKENEEKEEEEEEEEEKEGVEGYANMQNEEEEELQSTHSDTDMKEYLEDEEKEKEKEKEKENEFTNIQDDLHEIKDNVESPLIEEVEEREEGEAVDDTKEKEEIEVEEGEYDVVQAEEKEEIEVEEDEYNVIQEEEKEEFQSTHLDTEMNELLDEEKENENKATDIQDDHQMEKDDLENELVDMQEEVQDELQVDHTAADEEMNDLLENNEIENDKEDEGKEVTPVQQDNQSTHLDSEMNNLLDTEKIEDKDDEINNQQDETEPTSKQQENNHQVENDASVTELMNEIEDEEGKVEEEIEQDKEEKSLEEEYVDIQVKEEKNVEEDYVDIQVEEIQSAHSDSDIKVSSSSSPLLTTEAETIENKAGNDQVAELTNIQDDLQDDEKEVVVEKEDLDISLSEEEMDKENLENEINDETKDEKEGEEEYDDLQEVLQSDSEKKVLSPLPLPSPENDENKESNDDHVSTNIQEEDNNNDNNLQVENDDVEKVLVEEDAEIIEDVNVNKNNDGDDEVNEEGFVEIQEEDLQSTHSDTEMNILPNDDADDEMIDSSNDQSANEENHLQEKNDIENTFIEEIDENDNGDEEKEKQIATVVEEEEEKEEEKEEDKEEDKEEEEEEEVGEYDNLHEDLQSTHSDTEMKDLLGDQDVNELIHIETPTEIADEEEEEEKED